MRDCDMCSGGQPPDKGRGTVRCPRRFETSRQGIFSEVGIRKILLAHRGGHRNGCTMPRMVLYGKEQNVTLQTFLATYASTDGMIRVVIVKRSVDSF